MTNIEKHTHTKKQQQTPTDERVASRLVSSPTPNPVELPTACPLLSSLDTLTASCLGMPCSLPPLLTSPLLTAFLEAVTLPSPKLLPYFPPQNLGSPATRRNFFVSFSFHRLPVPRPWKHSLHWAHGPQWAGRRHREADQSPGRRHTEAGGC